MRAPAITDAEKARIRKMAQAGYSDTEIAQALGRDAGTMKWHRQQMGVKAGLSSTAMKVVNRLAFRKGARKAQRPRKNDNGGHLDAKGIFQLLGWDAPMHAPDDLCGGRRLSGREFMARKRELEKRDGTKHGRR